VGAPGTHASEVLLGLDLGGTKLSAVAGTADGRILCRRVVPTMAEDGRDALIARIAELLRGTRADAEGQGATPRRLGISHGGPVDPVTGRCRSVNLPDWHDVPLGEWLSAELGLQVAIDNDANAGALAEWRFGAGRGLSTICYMTMGTGIGGGIVSAGRVFRGASGMAGEIGHVTIVRDGRLCNCGRRGCLQAYASGPAIAAMAGEAALTDGNQELLSAADTETGDVPTESVCAAARRGNAIALRVLREAAVCMGIGVANFIKIVDPELVAIGTLAVKAGDLLLATIEETAYAEYKDLIPGRRPVVASELGDEVGDLAALALAAEPPAEPPAEPQKADWSAAVNVLLVRGPREDSQ